MRTDGHIDMTTPIVASRNFVSAPKNCSQGNVGQIFIPIRIFEEKHGDLQTCAFRFRYKTKDIKKNLF